VIDRGKRDILGIRLDAVDYDAAVERIIEAAHARRPYAVSALAVHGVMTGVDDPAHRTRLNRFDLLTPDGQPVRWALNLMYKTKLSDRVYGPEMTRRVLERAAAEGLPVYLYGSTSSTIELMEARLLETYPGLVVAGAHPSEFATIAESDAAPLRESIRNSGARITLVGLGCPRQEVFVFEHAHALSMPMLAVGAAFDYHAGAVSEPPAWMQRYGLQWAYRLAQDPRRLWRRYLVLNPRYVAAVARQYARQRTRPGAPSPEVPHRESPDSGTEPTWVGWA
jgi:N-acetylglucosaminyldiphosphoundecaprenol N-acetyl-beta-D-mannosaminyltransferase